MSARRAPTDDPLWIKVLIFSVVLAFLALVLVAPVVTVFVEALRRGLGPALEAIQTYDAQAAIKLTLLVAAITVPSNVVFGVCAASSVMESAFTLAGRVSVIYISGASPCEE